MDIKKFFELNPNIPSEYHPYCKSLLLAGEEPKNVLMEVQKRIKYELKAKKSATIDLSCPHCKSIMKRVTLMNGRQAKYCPKDRVCLPIKVL